MGDEEKNLFNTFSFHNWASKKKEEELDRENRQKRKDHIKKLKDKLRKEKERQKAMGPLGGSDLEAILAALSAHGVDAYGAGDNDWNESDDEVLKEIIPLVRPNKAANGFNNSNGYNGQNGYNGYGGDRRRSSYVEFSYNRKFQYDKFQ